MKRLALVFLFLLLHTSVWAHKPSDSYLSLTIDGQEIDGRWDIALRDVEDAIGLDADGDGAITWGEVRAKHQEIAAYAFSRLTLVSDRTVCVSRTLEQLIENHTDGAYSVLRFHADCARPIERLQADYRLLFDVDAQHKGLLRLTQGTHTMTAIFSQESPIQQFTIDDVSLWWQVRQYVHEGMWHIWLGFDHVLFLLALLLPAVLTRTAGRWNAIVDFSAAFWEVLSIVTAFTLAHSITLSLATLGMVTLPSRLVESAIAASVIVAGLSNLYPKLVGRRWVVAFFFGLIHGFGFAAVLADLGLPREALVLSLVSFNVGVEIGQLAIVAAFLPLAYFLRHTWTYQHVVVVTGSLAIAGIALLWLIERAFNLNLFPA